MSKLRSNMIYQAIYHVLAVCIPLVTSPYLSRVLKAEGLGIYSYNYSIVSYFILFALLGVSTYGMRAISQSKDKQEASRNFFGIYAFQLISSLVSLLAYVIFVIVFVKDDVARIVSWVQILYILGEVFNINWFFFGLEKYRSIVLRNIVIKLLTFISIFVFVKDEGDVVVYVLILALAHALSNIVIWINVRGNIVWTRIGWSDVAKHIKPNIVLFIPALAASVYHIMDKTMLGLLSDDTNSGYYYNADKLLNIPLTLVAGCSSVFMTRTCTLVKDNDTEGIRKTQNESIYFGMCAISAIAFGVCAVAGEFVPWYFGKEFEPCITLVKYFAVIVIMKTISTHTRSVFLIPESNDKSYAKAIVCGALINLVANFVLMYCFGLGALGATIGTLIAEVVVVIMQILFMKNASSMKACVKGILFSSIYLVLGALMLLVVEIIPINIQSLTVTLMLKILIGASVYMAECIVLWLIRPSLMPDMVKETVLQVFGKIKRIIKR